MTVYIAAPYPEKTRARNLAECFALHGITNSCRWIDSGDVDSDTWARYCLEDVARADVVVVLHPAAWETSGTGGRHVELGYAIALGKPILLVGRRTNLFHKLTSVGQVDETADVSHIIGRAMYMAAQPAPNALSLLKRLVIAWDADQDLEFVLATAEARAFLGFVLSDDEA